MRCIVLVPMRAFLDFRMYACRCGSQPNDDRVVKSDCFPNHVTVTINYRFLHFSQGEPKRSNSRYCS